MCVCFFGYFSVTNTWFPVSRGVCQTSVLCSDLEVLQLDKSKDKTGDQELSLNDQRTNIHLEPYFPLPARTACCPQMTQQTNKQTDRQSVGSGCTDFHMFSGAVWKKEENFNKKNFLQSCWKPIKGLYNTITLYAIKYSIDSAPGLLNRPHAIVIPPSKYDGTVYPQRYTIMPLLLLEEVHIVEKPTF